MPDVGMSQPKELADAVTRRQRADKLTRVYREFDIDGNGSVGEDELLQLGRARRKLGQKQGVWTAAMNRALMKKIGTDPKGAVRCRSRVGCASPGALQATFPRRTLLNTSSRCFSERAPHNLT